MSGSYGPSIQIARLYQKTSAKTGNTYFVGRLGAARMTILPNTRKSDEPDNNHDWVVLLSEAAPSTKPYVNGTATLPLPVPKPSPPPGPDPDSVPPWDPTPQDALKSKGVTHGTRDKLHKRVAGGGRSQLVDDIVPFKAEVR